MHHRLLSLLPLLSLLFAVACGGYKPPPLGACGDGKSLDDEDCPAGSFVATDRCFASLEAACLCLSCPTSRCKANNSEPAQVSCGAEEHPPFESDDDAESE